jgi:hypothetical protein
LKYVFIQKGTAGSKIFEKGFLKLHEKGHPYTLKEFCKKSGGNIWTFFEKMFTKNIKNHK